MPNLLDIRRRIRSVKNTQQITSAMKMVSAAKLRRAQEQALAARPYAQHLQDLMAGLAPYLDPQELAESRLGDSANWTLGALLERRPVTRRLVIAVTTDSGLVGAFNANVLKAALGLNAEYGSAQAQYEAVGRKARDYFKRHGDPLRGEHIGLFAKSVSYQSARDIAASAMHAYGEGAVDEVFTVGNEFKSVLQQVVTVRRLLPFAVPAADAAAPARDYIFETAPAQLLAQLLPRAIETQIYRSLLESLASEHAARMNAMDAATSNAGDLIETYTLNMNRIRQAAITKEIIEVVSGAAALE